MEQDQLAGGGFDAEIDLLAERRRRRVLRFLVGGSTERSSLAELVEHLADDSALGGPADREAIRSELHHRDLPKLADRGVIEYDSRAGDVRYHPHERIEELMGCMACD